MLIIKINFVNMQKKYLLFLDEGIYPAVFSRSNALFHTIVNLNDYKVEEESTIYMQKIWALNAGEEAFLSCVDGKQLLIKCFKEL